MTINEQIKKKRLELKISQNVLAEKIGITQSFLAQIESGKKNPSIDTIQKLCDALDLDFVAEKDHTLYASLEDISDLPPEAIARINEYIEMLKSKYGKKE